MMAMVGREPAGSLVPTTRRGVSLEFLRQWTEHKGLSGSLMTTAEVCAKVIKPITLQKACSYYELLVQSEATAEPSTDWWGPATHFLSHSWGYRFVDLLDILEAHEEHLHSERAVYYWFDICTCANVALRV